MGEDVVVFDRNRFFSDSDSDVLHMDAFRLYSDIHDMFFFFS